MYIDVDKFLDRYDAVLKFCECRFGKAIVQKFVAQIKEFPTEDVVSVVRCKDCKFAYASSKDRENGVTLCSYWAREMKLDDHCSRGEKQDVEDLR